MSIHHDPAVSIHLGSSRSVPEWAGLQRQLFKQLQGSVDEFMSRYTREDGSLIWRNEWPGMDGSDDPYEAFMYLSLLYSLTGDENAYSSARRIWDSITWTWTEYGQLRDEFDRYYDWMHHGEGYLFLYFMGLTKPESLVDRQRTMKFADLYVSESAGNYDVELRLIRSPLTGSDGPRHEITAEDFSTHRTTLDSYPPPFEDIPGVSPTAATCQWSDDATYDAIVKLFNERMARGDVPLNLNATSLVSHAYMYTGDETYRRWVVEYLDGWLERARNNGGIVPDNVGLSGVVGEYNEGKWWGGYYGWRWPHGLLTIIEPIVNACTNAVLITGDVSHLALARETLDAVSQLGKAVEGIPMVPHKHTDAGWVDYRVMDPQNAIRLWAVSFDETDLARIQSLPRARDWRSVLISTGQHNVKHKNANITAWFEFMQGNFPAYPERILKANLELVDIQLARMRSAQGDPRTWNSLTYIDGDVGGTDYSIDGYAIHAWIEFSPIYLEGALSLAWGYPMHDSHGGLQHASVRYFNPATRRPGLPENLAAQVCAVSQDSITLDLQNLSSDADAEVIVQAGAFAEHEIIRVQVEAGASSVPVDDSRVSVTVGPGCGGRLILTVDRFKNEPTYEDPWRKRADYDPLIVRREGVKVR